jgi:hypothetical protein
VRSKQAGILATWLWGDFFYWPSQQTGLYWQKQYTAYTAHSIVILITEAEKSVFGRFLCALAFLFFPLARCMAGAELSFVLFTQQLNPD